MAALLAAAPAQAAKRVALVIGNDRYAALPQLRNAVADARLVAETLKTELQFQIFAGENLDYRATNRLHANFEAAISPGDTVFVYFAGHGVAFGAENYLLPTDTEKPQTGEENLVRSEAHAVDALVRRVQARGALASFFVIDACRDNPFEAVGVRSIGGTRGLARADVPTGVFVLFSAGIGQTALDRLNAADTSPNSVFTRTLVPLLRQPGLTHLLLAKHVQTEVRALAASVSHQQQPAFYDQIDGEVVFKAAAPAVAPPVAPPATPPMPNASAPKTATLPPPTVPVAPPAPKSAAPTLPPPTLPPPAAPPAAPAPKVATLPRPTPPPSGNGFLGLRVEDVPKAMADKLLIKGGALVKGILDKGPAIDSDVEVGDVIVKLDDKPVSSGEEFRRLSAQTTPGTRVHVDLIHLGDDSWATIEAGQRPDQLLEPGTGYLGVRLTDVTQETADKLHIPPRGALVTEILDVTGTLIGLKVGDVIVKLQYDDITSLRDLQRRIASASKFTSQGADLYVIRNGKERKLFLQLDHISARWR
jgi:hypothetical protein